MESTKEINNQGSPEEKRAGSRRNAWTAVGFGAVLVSTTLFLASFLSADLQSSGLFIPELSIYFIGSYALALIFFIIRFIDRAKGDTHNYALFLVLFSISAFALNKELGVFSNVAPWATVSLVSIHLPLLLSNFRDKMPSSAKPLFYALSGFGAMLSLYFTLYILPIIPIGVIGFFFFGLSLHVLAPLLFFVEFVRYVVEGFKQHGWKVGIWGTAGIAMPIAGLLWFQAQWKDALDVLQQEYAAAYEQQAANDLPPWVQLAQHLPETPLFDKLLQVDLVYDAPSGYDVLLGNAGNGLALSKYHDPLVVLSAYIHGKPELSRSEQSKMIVHRADLHHQAVERLWSDEDLETASVISRIDLFPEHRIAYIEKELTIRNVTTREWREEQEALFTFYLPQSAVATSLSLWVNGKEEKGILTTKSKADSAYRQIVGRERRDPAVLHWQEGSMLRLRVFPCTPAENRRVKIGVTAPLQWNRGGLRLPNMYFSGPRLNGTEEKTSVHVLGKGELLEKAHLRSIGKGEYAYEGAYVPYWELAVESTPISQESFRFDGESYQTIPLEYGKNPLEINHIYLDINNRWDFADFEQICREAMAQEVKVWLHDRQWVEVEEGNMEECFAVAQSRNFSIFPIGQLPKYKGALVVTKMGHRSPALSEVQTPALLDYFRDRRPQVPVVNLGATLTPYWKTLLEFGALKYYSADVEGAMRIIREKKFPDYGRGRSIALPIAGMSLQMNPTADTLDSGGATDHLMRLYAYHELLNQVGSRYFTKAEYIEDPLLEIAQKANVVTPLSSLIVLETQQDYERFNIEKSKKSLENAQIAQEGAVPEPEEWMLLGLGALLLLLLKYGKKLKPSRG